ncbi:MAG: hypothetical protein HY431_00960 [Candidatus Levybacteria bacterium]|nr:hypothetical protein [Candidatus Levybacteria bacterium]
MDPKSFPPNLDPKLKEAYDRVMSMSSPANSPQPPATLTAPSTSSQSASPPQPAGPQAPISQPAGSPTPSSASQPPQMTGIAAGTPVNAPQTQAAPAAPLSPAKHGSPLMSVVYIVCGIVFILAYTLFWAKILNFQTPFPLPF